MVKCGKHPFYGCRVVLLAIFFSFGSLFASCLSPNMLHSHLYSLPSSIYSSCLSTIFFSLVLLLRVYVSYSYYCCRQIQDWNECHARLHGNNISIARMAIVLVWLYIVYPLALLLFLCAIKLYGFLSMRWRLTLRPPLNQIMHIQRTRLIGYVMIM